MSLLLALALSAHASPASWCAALEDMEPTLLYHMGVSPDTLAPLSDDDVIAGLVANPNDLWLQRIGIVRTRIWDSLAFKLDADGHITTGGTWRYGTVVDPGSGRALDAVHWADIDDDSWTFYFTRGTTVCAAVYEN